MGGALPLPGIFRSLGVPTPCVYAGEIPGYFAENHPEEGFCLAINGDQVPTPAFSTLIHADKQACCVGRRRELYALRGRPEANVVEQYGQEFQAQCTKDQLLARFGEHLVRLSTANTYSYHKVDLLFQDYVDHLLEPQDLASLGSETLYFFGNNNFTEWGSLFKKYNPPPFRIPGTTGAYSFGIGGSGSGVPFHWHGPGFSEHWFLYPPEKTPEFHPNRTTLSWFLDTYPFLPPREKPVLYFPDHWWHATLNLDTSVFISTFLG
ncbi:hypothetical protein E2320_012025 [Naja naja]|nr:hypothetical protein E2320_012025 [Naja naja]